MSDVDLRLRVEHLEAEVRALRAFEAAPYRAVVDDMTELVVRWKPDGTRTFVNDAYCRLFETPREELVGSTFWSLISEEDQRQVRERIARLVPDAPVSTGRHRAVRRNGELLWMEWCDRAIFDPAWNVIELQSVGRDITERVRLDERLRKVEQADAVARVSAAIAHDLAGMLQVIGMQVAYLGAEAGPDGEILRDAVGRGQALFKQLQQLAYGRIGEPVDVDLGGRIAVALPLMRELVGNRVRIDACSSPEPCLLRGDPTQIDQILFNLVRNAADAIADSGRVVLSTTKALPGALGERHRPPVPAPLGWCLLRVTDDGSGIDAKILPRIFDVHVTTKASGQGIGLATVKAIVEALGGSITVESSSAGTTFEIALPSIR